MKILPSVEKREHRSSVMPYRRPKGFVDKVKDWLTPSKWVPWRGDTPAAVVRESHVMTDGRSSAGSAPSSDRLPLSVASGKEVTDDSSSDLAPSSALLHEKMFTGRNGLVSGNPGVTPGSATLQRLSQQMEVDGNSPLMGVAPVTSDQKNSGPITSTPQVSPEMLAREMDVNEICTLTSFGQRGKQSFSVSTFHTPSHRHSKTELSLSQSPFKSPFYSGRTSFGGASSLRRKRERVESSPPVAVKVSQLRVQAQPALTTTTGSSASQTARRILNTLQSMSSPLTDARRLPLRVAPPAKRVRTGPSPITSPPPVSSLTAPSSTRLSRVCPPMVVPSEQRPSPGTRTVSFTLPSMETTPTHLEQGRKSISSISGSISPCETPPKVDQFSSEQVPITGKTRGGCGGKIRLSRHSSHYSSRRDSSSDNTPTNPLDLPPSISLTLSSSQPLPLLSFGAPPIPSSSTTRSPTCSPLAFSFAKPKPVMSSGMMLLESPDQGKKTSAITLMKTGLPLNETKMTPPSRGMEMTLLNKNINLSLPKKPDNYVSPSLKAVSVLEALKRPEYQMENIRKEAQLSGRGSVKMADLTDSDSPKKCEDVTHGLGGTGKSLLLPTKAAGTWSCHECWTSNKPGTLSCVACGTGKSLLSTKAAGTWSCDECWTSNKPGTLSCVACGTARDEASTTSLTGGSIPSIPLPKSLSGSNIGLTSGTSVSIGLSSKSGVETNTQAQSGSGDLRTSLGSMSGCGTSLDGGSGSGLFVKGGLKVPLSLSSFSGTSLSCTPPTSSISLASGGFKLGGVMLTTSADKTQDKNFVSQSCSSLMPQPSFKPLLTAVSETWSCSACYVKNNPDARKCIACETEKSGAIPHIAPVSKNSAKPSLSGQLPILKGTPADCWECSTCLVVNKSCATSCVACTTERPGPTHRSDHITSTSTAGESVFAKLTPGTTPGIVLGQSGSVLGLEKPGDSAENSGTGQTLGQPGLSLGQAGGMKLPPLTAKVFASAQSVSSGMQLPPLTATVSASHPQTLMGSFNVGLLPAGGGNERSNVVMPQLRKLHSSSSSTMPTASSGLLDAALQATGMVRGGSIQMGLPSTTVAPSSSSSQEMAPFNFAVSKSSSSSALQGLSFVSPTFPPVTSATTSAVSVATMATATFNFSGGAELKPVVSSVLQQPAGLFKPPATSLATKGAQSFPSSGSALGGGVSGGLAFGSKISSQSFSLGGPKLMFGGGMTATAGTGSSLQQQQPQQTPFALQAAVAVSQSKSDLSLPTGSSVSFGITNAPPLPLSSIPGTGFAATQPQVGQFGAGAQPALPTLASPARLPNTSAGFNFAQFSSTPQFQFGQAGAGLPATNSSIFQFGGNSNTSTSNIAGGSTPSISQVVPISQLGMPGISSLSGPVSNPTKPGMFSSGTGTSIGGRAIKKAVRRRR